MTTFAYEAVDRAGKASRGTLAAESRAAAMDAVSALGLMPTDVREQADGDRAVADDAHVKVPRKAVEAFTRELANLLAGGLSLSRALSLLKREASHPAAKRVWGEVHDDVVGGESLAEALAKWPQAFSDVYVAMVRAGEAGGFLDVVLAQIGEFREREDELKGKVIATLIYPAALAIIGTGVVIFLLTYFVPKLSGIFDQFGEQLPFITQITIGVSNFLLGYGPFVAIGLVVLAFVVRQQLQTPEGRRRIDDAVLRIPLIGTVMARFALVRFCRMLGTLLGAGVPLLASMKVAREALGNRTLVDAVTEASDEVQRGVPLSRALASHEQLFPTSAVEMISVSEETGRTGEELVRLAKNYEGDLDRKLRYVVSLAEPVILLLIAVIVGFMVISMLLPLFTLQDMIN